jgi:spore coat protein CotH
MTRKEKRDFTYLQDANIDTLTADELVKKMKPFIYKALNLAPLAEKAKDEGYIKSYYDVIEALFEPTEIFEIIAFIMKINNVTGQEPKEELEEIKK